MSMIHGKMTDADKLVHPQQFGTDLAVIRIWINQDQDHFWLELLHWRRFAFSECPCLWEWLLHFYAPTVSRSGDIKFHLVRPVSCPSVPCKYWLGGSGVVANLELRERSGSPFPLFPFPSFLSLPLPSLLLPFHPFLFLHLPSPPLPSLKSS